eukprot:scaffold101_cov373-Prasinococcus_capsulatus_cf.AAC.7
MVCVLAPCRQPQFKEMEESARGQCGDPIALGRFLDAGHSKDQWCYWGDNGCAYPCLDEIDSI